ncbi:MAG: DmsE family decaheme c-type cytochrome [Armatimonadota bacterium]|nr:DmsE family decaheme c-type cytochrome [Armatimonadota bacterium]
MRKRKIVFTLLLCLALGTLWGIYSQRAGQAEEQPKYVGAETCATCHAEVAKKWQLTTHRRTLFNKDESRRGCEACHGPGGEHVAGGGDKTKIIKIGKLSPTASSNICLKCHTHEKVTLWHTSTHARAKLTCMTCHDPHSLDAKNLLSDVENGKLNLEGITRSIKQAQLEANAAKPDSPEKKAALDEVDRLEAKRDKLRKELGGQETAYRKSAEPYMCYNCHKAQETQARMPSHHPINEGKMKCSDCHNPHGGANGMLRQESVVETCSRCHNEKVGPFTFEHPPVSEDCTICHKPHGSVQNTLLAQNQPFLCLKCHAGPHSRGSALASPATFSRYYTECTDCHNQIHGSDRHQPFHY